MFLESEDAAVVKANTLENSVTVKQTVIENGYLRVRFRIELSVDINLRFFDAGCRARATLHRRFDCRLSSRLVSFWFVYHRRISGFHSYEKNLRCFSAQFKPQMRSAIKLKRYIGTLWPFATLYFFAT